MTDQATMIEEDDGTAGLGGRILAALENAGIGDGELTPEILAPADQIHGGGLASTVSQAAEISLGPDMRVLDVGCGIGGPARYLATTFGCRVTGIDLSADSIETARLLTAKMALQDRVDFDLADATMLPFEDGAFDVVWCQNVAMNIADRTAFHGGIHRVLKPGGVFTMTELCLGPGGPPNYPTPWARDPANSFLFPPVQVRASVEGVGFRVRVWRDTSASRAGSDRAHAAGTSPVRTADSPLTIEITCGQDYPARRANSSNGVLKGKLVNMLLVAERSA